MLFDQAMDVQSTYSLPSESHTSAPAALVMTRPGSLPEDHPLNSAARPTARSSADTALEDAPREETALTGTVLADTRGSSRYYFGFR